MIAEKKYPLLLLVVAAVLWVWPSCAFGQPTIGISSSPNPVGAGAKALGMGGAFIGVADDATSASWNPGGLVQLKTPEISFVANGLHRIDDTYFPGSPEANGSNTVSEAEINYLSAVYPFNLFKRNMILSLNYQNLYDFSRNRDFQFLFSNDGGGTSTETTVSHQSGTLSAIGVAYCVQVVPEVSMGVTLNFWDDDITSNNWESETETFGKVKSPFAPSYTYTSKMKDKYELRGFNANLGTLWRATDKLTIGGVVKLPFTADLHHENENESFSNGNLVTSVSMSAEEKMDMPWSTGVGVAYRFSDQLTVSADMYWTEWGEMAITDSSGMEKSPITGKPTDESHIDPTKQVRTGVEYLFVNQEKKFIVPLRAGLFYDPEPAEGEPDDYFGVSFGSGFSLEKYIFDITYQYRFGNDVGNSEIQYYESSQDVEDHQVYSSMIIHF